MWSILFLGPLARIAPRVLAWALAAIACTVLVLLGLVGPALAEELPPLPNPAATLDPSLLDSVRALALDKAGEPTGSRLEVVIGQLDPRLRLAPCRRVEPYLPVGVRLWGKARIGLRCKEGATAWNVFLPITVKVYGRAVILAGGGAAGSVLSEADVSVAEVDLAEEFTAAIVDPKLAVGRTLAQAMRPGQTLRQGQLKLRQWFAAGDTVKVIAAGDGFALESEGQALGNGLEGQLARVRTESGKIVSGLPSGERRIDLSL
ncbi:MAG: flagellar basal body P-ring formation chaperone FlgA [Pseudomonadota bacterium]|nr:flagellar basal body P-ring formation chaperone FlgA [Pseudomonadota bacterium]